MVSRFNNAKTGAPAFILVQENENGTQSVMIQVNYCPWCGERLDGAENDGEFCEPKRGGNLPEKYLAFVRRVLNDKALVPAADVAPIRYGHWVKRYRSGTPAADGWVSSCCDMWAGRKSHYCPHCGAKMEGDENNA